MASGDGWAYDRVVLDPDPGSLPQAFAVEVRRTAVTAHVRVSGELDLLTAPELQRALDEVLAAGVRHVVLDLRELEFIDSTGMRVVYGLDQLSRQDGFNAAIVRGDPAVQRAFTIAGLAETLVFVDRPEDLSPPGV